MPKLASTPPHPSASALWANCVERVGGLCESIGQLGRLTHSQKGGVMPMGKNASVSHTLYHFLYSAFSHKIFTHLSLLSGSLYTLSTWPINTTTTYINKY